MSILGPQWLVSQINTIALIIAAVIAVIFSDHINRYVVLPITDTVHKKTKKHSSWGSKILATAIFVLYCYFSVPFLARYILAPILREMKVVLILALIGIFCALLYVITNPKIRKKYMKV